MFAYFLIRYFFIEPWSVKTAHPGYPLVIPFIKLAETSITFIKDNYSASGKVHVFINDFVIAAGRRKKYKTGEVTFGFYQYMRFHPSFLFSIGRDTSHSFHYIGKKGNCSGIENEKFTENVLLFFWAVR